jgi:nucleotide-binding universal stress UspA family protein
MSLQAVGTQRKVIWAIDPFETLAKPNPVEIDNLKTWLAEVPSELILVHVYHSLAAISRSGKPGRLAIQEEAALKQEVLQYVGSLNLGEALPAQLDPAIVPNWHGSTGSSVDALVAFAREVGADAIVVTSQGASGLKRLALGSFTETLLLRSPVPVRVFGHGREVIPSGGIDRPRVLVPVDFSPPSKQVFQAVAAAAAARGAEVTLLHLIPRPAVLSVDPGLFGTGVPFPMDEYMQAQEECAKEWADQVVSNTQSPLPPTRIVIRQCPGAIAETILAVARDLGSTEIAMATSSGALAAVLLGGVARKVVRDAEIPVQVYGPHWMTPEVSKPKRRSHEVDA